jgi:hypothetical protein
MDNFRREKTHERPHLGGAGQFFLEPLDLGGERGHLLLCPERQQRLVLQGHLGPL